MLNVPLFQAGEKLVSFFKSVGAHYVFDLTFAKDFALIERFVENE